MPGPRGAKVSDCHAGYVRWYGSFRMKFMYGTLIRVKKSCMYLMIFRWSLRRHIDGLGFINREITPSNRYKLDRLFDLLLSSRMAWWQFPYCKMFRIASSCNGKSCTNKYEESVGSKRAIPSEFSIRTQDLLYISRHVRRWRKWRTKKKRLRSKTVNYNLKNYHKIIDIVTVSTNLLRFFFYHRGMMV